MYQALLTIILCEDIGKLLYDVGRNGKDEILRLFEARWKKLICQSHYFLGLYDGSHTIHDDRLI